MSAARLPPLLGARAMAARSAAFLLAVAASAALAACAEAGLGGRPGDGNGGPPGSDGGVVIGPDGNPIVTACAEELAAFDASVMGPILSVRCAGCHNEQGPAAGSRLVLSVEGGPGTLERNYSSVYKVATAMAGNKPLLLAMPSDTNPERRHPGGRLVPEGSAEYAALQALVTRMTSPACDGTAAPAACTEPPPGFRRLVRLTPVQYDNAVKDLLGVEGAYGSTFPADTVVNGFSGNAAELQVTPLLADKMLVAAEDIAAKAELARVVPCDVAAGDATCERAFVTAFGERIFRRPLGEPDVARYLRLYEVAGSFEAGTRLVLAAMLQSPHFVYRFELGMPSSADLYRLTDFEVASELSFTLWDTTPDPELLDAARQGALHTEEQIAAATARMVASERVRPVVKRFVFQWLGLDAIGTVPKDATTFPELTPEIRASMRAEAERLVDHVVFEKSGTVAELLTTPVTFLDQELAAFYGAVLPAGSADPSGLSEVSLPERSGLLTLGGVMLTHSRSNDSSPIHRGKMVRDRILCQPPSPPPPGINAQPPPLDPSQTVRERYAAHSTNEPCHSCHRLLDPIGFAFEHFDGVGRYRDLENGHPIDVAGQILESPRTEAEFAGTSELAKVLSESPDVEACFTLQWFRFAYGLTDTERDRCAVEDLGRRAESAALSLRDLLSATTRTSRFVTRVRGDGLPPPGTPTVEAGPPDPPPTSDSGAPPPPPEDAGPPPPVDDLLVERVQENDWGAGYCYTYHVQNEGTSDVEWAVTLDVEGTINNSWESVASATGGTVTFTGAPHNHTLAPGASAQFGFCANR